MQCKDNLSKLFLDLFLHKYENQTFDCIHPPLPRTSGDVVYRLSRVPPSHWQQTTKRERRGGGGGGGGHTISSCQNAGPGWSSDTKNRTGGGGARGRRSRGASERAAAELINIGLAVHSFTILNLQNVRRCMASVMLETLLCVWI